MDPSDNVAMGDMVVEVASAAKTLFGKATSPKAAEAVVATVCFNTSRRLTVMGGPISPLSWTMAKDTSRRRMDDDDSVDPTPGGAHAKVERPFWLRTMPL